ncbi:MAG: hypothetical protein DMENIID0002_01560 [Rickettsia endosymbiont of Sergentomyia squamirostris]|uniref:Uncharacterized protein n=1 Tax=Candidatus Tisiphia endosymbiont of Sergentomyia squamirostris TaxID=3113639 RepID=A0AAT9G6V5_9RICK
MRKNYQITNNYNKSLLLDNQVALSKTVEFTALVAFFLLCYICLLPEITFAASLENQLDKAGGLANGKVKTIGLSAATVLSSIWSVVRGNIKLAGVIVAIGVILGFYLEWIAGGMKVT